MLSVPINASLGGLRLRPNRNVALQVIPSHEARNPLGLLGSNRARVYSRMRVLLCIAEIESVIISTRKLYAKDGK